ncbi:MAG: phage terminase large subunit family protein [Sedimentisphaerales bacterium]|nr:phage terminase large subunit family protein [Sedimentisphaerales bacterium]
MLHGGLFALAMPRGSGKTVLMQMACLWSALSGATEFVCLIASSADRAKDLLENIKVWLETNPLLAEDFPEVTFPIRALERITNRQKGQKHEGTPTRIEWSADKIVLPTIAGSCASGVVISCSGMKGSEIRGQNYARADGKVVRPQLVMVDDPQTTESAWSPSQSQRREAILAGDVLGMAGPGKKISGLMACTVIRPGDMADNILDRDKHPEWQGERTKMVYVFPQDEKLWAKYAEIRGDSLRNGGDGGEATEFYRENREAMDTGAVIAWPQRHNNDELSAIQHAMNLKLRDEAAFFAEYQNEPIIETEGEEMLTPEQIAGKTNGYARSSIPVGCNHLTLFIDVQQKALFWMLCGWEDGFTGYIIDYGTWPDQKRQYFTLRDCRRTLIQAKPGAGLEGAIYNALEKLSDEKLPRVFLREDGLEMRIDRCLIDANWGQSTDVVYQFCRQSQYAGIILPSHGKYVGASSMPFSEYRRKRGDRVGHHWRIPNTTGRRAIRHVLIDTNYWKSFIHARLAVAMGDPGCLSLFGRDEKLHRLLAEHLTAEYRIKTMARDRIVDEWKLKAARPDNHWFDCLVGCAVAVSIAGVSLETLTQRSVKPAKRIKLSELQKQSSAFRPQSSGRKS